ncbi:Coiled-coil domain-containing protein 137, partial [Manacus vitellinus]
RKERKVDNMKPKHPEEQEIPFRLREIMQSREAMKRLGQGKRKAAGGTRRSPNPRGTSRCPGSGGGRGSRSVPTSAAWSRRCSTFQKKKLEKARKKKEEKKVDMLEKSLFQDTVAFGEVVTQPPTITSRPRGRGPAEQAGRKPHLLTPRLGRSQASPVSPVMSMARRRIVEEERARVIQAYRDIQRRKQLQRERSQ